MKELTLLEKFAAGWEIRAHDDTTITDIFYLKNGNVVIRWSDGELTEQDDNDSEGFTFTLPRERRWVNIGTETGSLFWVSPYETRDYADDQYVLDNAFATLCIEKQDGRWQLVKDENA